jgi:hypothetical protein
MGMILTLINIKEPPMDYTNGSALVPQIEEIRMIRGTDGEDYINVSDMTKAMKVVAMNMPTPTLSVLAFIRKLTIELITARR